MSDDYLGGIFDRVLATPFTLRASDEERFGKKEGGASTPKNAAQKQYVIYMGLMMGFSWLKNGCKFVSFHTYI